MIGSDQTRSAGTGAQAPGQPVELTQADIEALARGGQEASEVRKRMDAESLPSEAAQAEQPVERREGGKAAPDVEPPADSRS